MTFLLRMIPLHDRNVRRASLHAVTLLLSAERAGTLPKM